MSSKGFCSRCGDCCEAIPFNRSLDYMRERIKAYQDWAFYYSNNPDYEPGENEPTLEQTKKNYEDATFIVKHWTRIEKEEAVGLMPLLSDQKKYFYTCNMLDKETRLCTAHDERPPVCRDYPWYDRKPSGKSLVSKRCGFWYDVDEEERPDNILPIVETK